MDCYYHAAQPAVGVCKSCQRGVCRECVTEVPDGIACRDRCEVQATALGRMMRENAHSMLIMGIIFALMGVMIGGKEVYDHFRYDYSHPGMLALGGLFVLSGLFLVLRWVLARRKAVTVS